MQIGRAALVYDETRAAQVRAQAQGVSNRLPGDPERLFDVASGAHRLRRCRAAPGSRLRAHPLRGRPAAALRIPGAGAAPLGPPLIRPACGR